MFELARIKASKLRRSLAICGFTLAALPSTMWSTNAVAAGEAAAGASITLALAYVPPPHVPGAKVRTPEGPAPLLAERLSKNLPLHTVQLQGGGKSESHADALLVPLTQEEAAAKEGAVISTGYRAGIMAIMRTDTDIKRWEDLRDRIVCLAEGSGLAGQMQARYGAIEKLHRAPADALLDLRIGGCDATVHDSTMLHALLSFPEWKKFSARLPVQQERELAFVVNEPDAEWVQDLRSTVRQWRDKKLLAKLTEQSAHDIAFEVYMDQEVPDCH